VGAGGAGGGGGGGGVAFFPHAPNVKSALRARTKQNHFRFMCFTFYSSRDPKKAGNQTKYLLRFT
jgi:hypothetical protein